MRSDVHGRCAMPHVLLVEPQQALRDALRRALEASGFDVSALPDVDARFSAPPPVDVIVANVVLPSDSGLGLLDTFVGVPLILTAAADDVRGAVAAIKAGAANYLVHPIAADELVTAITAELAVKGVGALQRANGRGALPSPLVGSCSAMTTLLQRVHAVAAGAMPVLIVGEVGSGREQIARTLHAESARSRMPLIVLNCSVVPRDLIESELFGYEPGSVRGAAESRAGLIEVADGGTLFIEDIADLAIDTQERLLRVVESGRTRRLGASTERTVDVRVLAATQRDLRLAADKGEFQRDLYQRLGLVTLTVPPLRERGGDLPDLARHLLKRACARLARPEPLFTHEALAAIQSYPWPGNVRELENAVERALIVHLGSAIRADDLGIDTSRGRQTASAVAPGEEATTLEDYFVRFVTEHQDDLTETELAQKLGISRKSLWERRQRLNIPRRRTHKRGPRRDG